MTEIIGDAIYALQELQEDVTVPKNIKLKLEEIVTVLKSDEELSIKVNKALNELDEISDDANIHPHTRTQIWNIASILETL